MHVPSSTGLTSKGSQGKTHTLHKVNCKPIDSYVLVLAIQTYRQVLSLSRQYSLSHEIVKYSIHAVIIQNTNLFSIIDVAIADTHLFPLPVPLLTAKFTIFGT